MSSVLLDSTVRGTIADFFIRVMYFMCGVCNFKLMLNTNFNEPLPEEETIEADAGTRNE